jgi:hypothetical protein
MAEKGGKTVETFGSAFYDTRDTGNAVGENGKLGFGLSNPNK